MQHNTDETMAMLECKCGATFFRATVYGGIYCMDKCPRCNSKELTMLVKDVTKIWSVKGR